MWNPFLWRPLYCFIRTARSRFRSKRRSAAGEYLLTAQSFGPGTPTIKKCSEYTSSRSKPAQLTLRSTLERRKGILSGSALRPIGSLGPTARALVLRQWELRSYSFSFRTNGSVSNVEHKAGPVWGIRGVERGGSGKAPAAAREFKRAISWKSRFSVEVV